MVNNFVSLVLIVFGHMITDMDSNRRLVLLLLNCFYEKESSILCYFYLASYFKVPETIKLNATHFIMKIPKAANLLSDTDFKNFMKPYKDYTKDLYSFLY